MSSRTAEVGPSEGIITQTADIVETEGDLALEGGGRGAWRRSKLATA